jgi:hypothetical protein
MNINIKIKQIIFLLLIAGFITAQEQNNIDAKIDSLRLESKYNFLLHSEMIQKMPIYFGSKIVDPFELPFEDQLIRSSEGNISTLNLLAMNRIRNEMSQSFQIFRRGQNKYYLGVVSDVLGYVGTTAVAGLTAYHLYKYHKKYGLK